MGEGFLPTPPLSLFTGIFSHPSLSNFFLLFTRISSPPPVKRKYLSLHIVLLPRLVITPLMLFFLTEQLILYKADSLLLFHRFMSSLSFGDARKIRARRPFFRPLHGVPNPILL